MSVIVKSLSRLFQEQKALDDVSFEAKPGEILGFLGPNGAGKTTTMKIITAYLKPSGGEAIVCGESVLENPEICKSRIGYLPEHNPLYKDMYIKEYLHFIGRIHKHDDIKARIKEMIEITGLGEEQHKKIGELSKGYRQRVGLAQAMFHDPEVYILDEPTSGLDPNQLREIRNLIRNLGKNKTVIFSTHIMQEVQALCDRVIIIDHGKIVADRDIETLSLLAAGESQIHIELKQEVDLNNILKIKGINKIIKINNRRWRVYFSSDQDIRESIFKTIVKNGLTLLEMSLESSSVEDVFQKLTNH